MAPLDLTLVISPELPAFPGSPKPQFIQLSSIKNDGYNLELLHLSSHTGTHIDAPYHFAPDGAAMHQIPLERLIGKGILIKSPKSANTGITREDITQFEHSNGVIPNGSSIFFFTGWQKNLKHDSYFTHNPGLDESAARYVASKNANLVGIDSPSIDLGCDESFCTHHILSEQNILIVENLANLDRIPSLEFDFAILPLNLYGATGSPVRAVAL